MQPNSFKTEAELDTHIIMHQLHESILNMSKEFSNMSEYHKAEIQSIKDDVKEIKTEMSRITDISEKLVELIAHRQSDKESVDAAWAEIRANRAEINDLKNQVNQSCDIASNSLKKYTNEAVGSLWRKIVTVAAAVVLFGGSTWYMLKDEVTYHIRDKSIHHEHKKDKDDK